MKIYKFLLSIFLISAFITSSCLVTGFSKNNSVTNHTLETNDNLDIIWETTNIKTNSSEQRPPIVSSPGKIIVEGWNNDAALSLFAFDSGSGNMIWSFPFNSNSRGYIISEETMIYRGTFGAANVTAYNTDNGEILWKTGLPFAHSTSEIYFANEKIFVFTSDNMFFILNKQGEVLDTRHETFNTYLEMDGVLYFDENISLKAVNIATRKELWRLKIDDRFTHSPIFDNGTIFLRTWTTPGYIYSIDQFTGEINWKISQNALSNLSVTDKSVYFLDFDGYLIAIDRYSGNEIFKAKFIPQFDLSKGVDRYFISADPTSNVLAIVFGDNSQILGLKIKNP